MEDVADVVPNGEVVADPLKELLEIEQMPHEVDDQLQMLSCPSLLKLLDTIILSTLVSVN